MSWYVQYAHTHTHLCVPEHTLALNKPAPVQGVQEGKELYASRRHPEQEGTSV